ncbi:MAG: hypothetical protein H6Q08_3061 [Acidobacteria bacterium]|nr:hypothetical protein [Acidobacteriota bacterium]
MQGPQRRLLAARQAMERRVLDLEIPLPHRAPDLRDGVARHAAEPGLRLGRVDLLLDRTIEHAAEEHRVVVAARAPARRARAHDVLHVLNGLPVPLVVERREMVGRRVPLVVDVLVTALARSAREEEIRRHDPARAGVGRRWEERTLHSGALVVHRGRRRLWVPDRKRFAQPGIAGQGGQQRPHRRDRHDREPCAERPRELAARPTAEIPDHRDGDEQHRRRGRHHVRGQQVAIGPRGAEPEHGHTQGAGQEPNSQRGCRKSPQAWPSNQRPTGGRDDQRQAQYRVQRDL